MGAKETRIAECSIVMPVFNQYQFTEQCLEAIRNNTGGTCEIIIVDNGSTDQTTAMSETAGVRILRQKNNLGYAAACNIGARAVSGRFVVFLNNDTVPQSGWLRALLDTHDAESDAGVVGCKTILAGTGCVQFTGLVFDAFRQHYPIYGGLSPEAAAVNRTMEFQALSGVCLLVEREFFLGLGGFDERLRNCLEDVDICLAARKAGRRVIYCPQSVVRHHASATLRTDMAAAWKNIHDCKIYLYEKWGDFIENDDYKYFAADEAFISESGISREDFYCGEGFAGRDSGYSPALNKFFAGADAILKVQELKDFIKRVIAAGMLSQGISRVACYGASDAGWIFFRAAAEAGLKVMAVIDSDVSKQGKEMLGLVVEGPEALDNVDADAIMICSTGQIDAIRNTIALHNPKNLPVFSLADNF